MRTIILAIAIVLVLAVGSASATNFWISPSNTSSAPPANAAAIPTLPSSGTMYVWAKVDPGKTLANWSLNIHTSSPGVINFTSVDVLNPLLGVLPLPGPDKDIRRYEFINESPSATLPVPGGQAMDAFQGFTVASSAVLGVGIGPDTTGDDPNYDAGNESWLIAEITYTAAGGGSTDLFLQIGVSGLNNLFESSSDTNVILGALTDPGLNGESGRAQDSLTPEAIIFGGGDVCLPPRFLNAQGNCIPEPSSVVLAALAVLCLAWFGRNTPNFKSMERKTMGVDNSSCQCFPMGKWCSSKGG